MNRRGRGVEVDAGRAKVALPVPLQDVAFATFNDERRDSGFEAGIVEYCATDQARHQANREIGR